MIAPTRICRRPPAPGVGAVDHIVMNQRGAVQQLDHGAQANRALAVASARVARGKQQERRAQTFAAAAQEIAGDFGNRLERSGSLPRQLLLHQNKVVPDEVKNFPGRQQCDDFLPACFDPVSAGLGQYHAPARAVRIIAVPQRRTLRASSRLGRKIAGSSLPSPAQPLPRLSFSHYRWPWPPRRRRPARCVCPGTLAAPGTESLSQSKDSPTAKLSQRREGSGLSDTSNFPQKKS